MVGRDHYKTPSSAAIAEFRLQPTRPSLTYIPHIRPCRVSSVSLEILQFRDEEEFCNGLDMRDNQLPALFVLYLL